MKAWMFKAITAGVVGLLLAGILLWPLRVLATENDSKLEDLRKQIEEITAKLKSTQEEKDTLSANIRFLDNKILLNEKQIEKTQYEISLLEKEIEQLADRIEGLKTSLGELSQTLIARVQNQYKRRATDPVTVIFATTGMNEFFNKSKYTNQLRQHTQELLLTTERKRQNYDQERSQKQRKQEEQVALQKRLEQQQNDLEDQKAAKRELLAETQNNEKIFQQKLAALRAEMEAIDAVIAGKGKETAAGDVKEGDVIARVISGASCNSSGTHLHFIVTKNGVTQNPFGFLKSIDHRNCSRGGCGGGGDPFNPSGDWEWPLKPQITLTQGYGKTWAVQNTWAGRIYSFHNGIDISGSSLEVRAPKSGKLFRGAYTGSKGCALRYVRVEHKDSDISTFYLHINY